MDRLTEKSAWDFTQVYLQDVSFSTRVKTTADLERERLMVTPELDNAVKTAVWYARLS